MECISCIMDFDDEILNLKSRLSINLMKNVDNLPQINKEDNTVKSFNSDETYLAPRDYVEIEVQKIWNELFNQNGISINSNFFELGGHSLLVLHLINKISNKFNVELSVVDCLNNPTIENLSISIRKLISLGEKENENCFVKLKESGSRNPIFLAHSNGGFLVLYTSLVRQMDEDQPVFGFQLTKLNEKQTLQEIAHDYVEEMIKHYPKGPYNILGFSAGGLLAFEMANQLLKRNLEVGFLGLLDTFPIETSSNIDEFVFIKEFVEQRFNANKNDIDYLKCANEKDRLIYILSLGKQKNFFTPDQGVERVNHILKSYIKINTALKSYVINSISCDITFFKAIEEKDNPIDYWMRSTTGKVECINVPGDHHSMIKPPHVEVLVKEIIKAIDEKELKNS
jgi:thioesterase domain-containing protein/acyl carrier protein